MKDLRGKITCAEALSRPAQMNGAFVTAWNRQRDAGGGTHAGNNRERAFDPLVGQQALHNGANPVVAHFAHQAHGLSHTLESQAGVSDGPAQIDHEFAALSEPALGQQVACNGISIAGSEPGQDIQNQRTGHKNMAFCEKTHHSFPSLIP